jgi:hypothetical protein
MKEVKVYIASPYSNGWMPSNIKLQFETSDKLLNLGYFPYVPLLSHFLEIYSTRSEHQWLELDFVFLKTCDAVLRLQNKDKHGNFVRSPGADQEEALAKKMGIPVFHSLQELNDHFKSDPEFSWHQLKMDSL